MQGIEQFGVSEFLTLQSREDRFLNKFVLLLVDIAAAFSTRVFSKYFFFWHVSLTSMRLKGLSSINIGPG